GELFRYFPETLHRTFRHAVETHRLRREVIATVLANAMINRGGPAFVTELTSASSASAGEIALAYAATRDIYGLTELNTSIDGLDGAVGGQVQLTLYAAVEALLRQETLWFLRNADVTKGAAALVARHAGAVATLKTLFATTLPAPLATAVGNAAQALVTQNVPAAIAQRVAELGVLSFASDIALVSERSNASVAEAAEAFFGVLAQFSLWPVIEQGRTLVLSDRFERMALDRALANLMRAQRDLAADALAAGSGSIADRVAAWKAQTPGVDRSAQSVAELTQGTLTVSRLSVAAGLLADLAQAS
ncbi:MAG: NAD-glutamate dehydrogenase, partial [Devosia sp.]